MLVGHIIAAIEEFAPKALQEDYDNTGLIIGSPAMECDSALLTVDVTPAVVQEAIDRGCQLIISHHPLVFKGLKRFNGTTPVEQSVMMAIRAGIAVYACHTAVDNARQGVSMQMCRMLGLDSPAPLDPQTDRCLKLVTFVPKSHTESVRLALFDAGAGSIGDYDFCSFSSEGTGTFRPLDGADPFVGSVGDIHHEPEVRMEVLLPIWLKSKVSEALLQTHPYEEPAYEFLTVDTNAAHTGCGAVGNLPEPLSPAQLADLVKRTFGSPVARCTSYPADSQIRRVALCGGSGSFLISKAIAAGAQAFISSDTKYHDFVDYADSIFLIDIGHHESENCTKDIFYHIITKKFPNFAVEYSQKDTNPINYL